MQPIKPTNPPKRKSKPKAPAVKARQKEHSKLQEILRQLVKVQQLKEDLVIRATDYCKKHKISLKDTMKMLYDVISEDIE